MVADNFMLSADNARTRSNKTLSWRIRQTLQTVVHQWRGEIVLRNTNASQNIQPMQWFYMAAMVISIGINIYSKKTKRSEDYFEDEYSLDHGRYRNEYVRHLDSSTLGCWWDLLTGLAYANTKAADGLQLSDWTCIQHT